MLESGCRVLNFDHPVEEPYEVNVWLEGEPVWTIMVQEQDVWGKLVLVFPALPKEHFAYQVEVTPTEEEFPHKAVAPSAALRQLVSEFRLSKDDLASSSYPASEVGNGQGPGG